MSGQREAGADYMPSPQQAQPKIDLFVAQSFDRIQAGSAIRGVEAESDPDHRANQQSGDRPAVRKNQIDFEPGGEEISEDYSQNDSQNSAGFGNENGLGQKLPQNVFAARANRFTDADFFRSLGHAYEHDVHNSDAGCDQRDETDHECADPYNASHGNERAFKRIVRINLEIVFLVCAQTPRDPHRADGFVERGIVGLS